MLGRNAGSSATLTMTGDSYFESAHAMYMAYYDAGIHTQINLFGGTMDVGSLGPNLGTWEIHIRNGAKLISRGDSIATIQGYIDAGNIHGDEFR